MNGPEHPHVDVLADHHDGLLAGDEQAAAQHHLAGCAGCRHLVAQLDEVSRLLAAEGQRPVTMPSSVAARLEGALTEEAAKPSGSSAQRGDEHQSAAVASLTSRRAPGARSEHRRVWPVLAAAAAVVAFSAVGIQVMQRHGGEGLSAGAQNDSVDESVQEGANAAPKGDSPASANGDYIAKAPAFRKSQRASVAALARNLAQGNSEALDARGVCATPDLEASAAQAGPVSLIRWRGSPALLEVDVARHRLVVLDCKLPGRRLFTTTY